jgi:hypothetical protein
MQRVKIDRQRFAGAFTAAAILVGALAGVVQSSAGAGWVENLWARIIHRHTVDPRRRRVDRGALPKARDRTRAIPANPLECAATLST